MSDKERDPAVTNVINDQAVENGAVTTTRSVQFVSSSQPASKGADQDTKDFKGESKKAPAKKLDIEEHLLTFDQLKERHNTFFNTVKPAQSKGLSGEIAKQRLAQYGPNILTPPKKKHPFLKFMEHLLSLFNALLILSGILTYVLYGIVPAGNTPNLYIGAILIAVSFINAFIEFYQLQKSAAILESFMNMIPAKATLIRDGTQLQIAACELVIGDVVFCRLGDKVPADLYIFHGSDFKVDNSSLTGESEPQERVASNTHENPLEATNLAFNGTLAVAGEAYGVVIRTGDNTVLGQIAGLTSSESKRKSPLSIEIDRFVYIIGGVAIVTAIVFFIVAYVKSGQVAFALNFAIGVLVAWVPQGLPATVTMLLTIAAKRMATEQVLVKDLQGVETLGAITLLATDKTGTLTRNQMTATCFWTSSKMLTTATENFAAGELPVDMSISGFSEILHISAMCSRARFDRTDVPLAERKISGDATESGLFRYAAAKLSNIDQLEDKYAKVFEIPFNSDTKWHMAIHNKPHANGSLTQSMKGAPERILRVCDSILIDGNAIPMTEEHRKEFNTAYEYMAGKGHRVLAFAQLLLPESEFPANFQFSKEDKNFKTTGLCFVGLASLEDPPKHGVREAVGHCRGAGIKVMMVTGDHPLTAEAIGRKINLMLGDTKESLAKRTGRKVEDIKESETSSIVIHGEKIDFLTEEDWENIFSKDEIIFARTSPKHKLQIVKHAQALGHIVGVTGDGVNDSPALKKADLGIAMNLSGSDVSKEAAAMILLDDNFASTVNGIAEGRLIFANLKKSIRYVVTHIIPEVLPYLLYVIIPIPVAIGALQILVVDLGFELFAALSYAFELPESKGGLMRLPPRKPVTPESIKRKKAREAEQAAHALILPHDTEAGNEEEQKPSKLQLVIHTCKQITQGWWWKQAFTASEGDVLVDLDGLSYSYLEGGIIEFLGALTTFFVVFWNGADPATGQPFRISPWDSVQMQANGNYFVTGAPSYTTVTGNTLTDSAQVEALAQAQSGFYFSVMIIQMFNLFACKTRFRQPFGRYMFQNLRTWGSIFTGVGFAVVIVYAPPFNIAFQTSYHLSPLYWLIPMAFGVLLIGYNSLRQFVKQLLQPVKWNPEIAGLQMYPTHWSTGR